MSYVYNVTDYNEINEFYPTKREAIAQAKGWGQRDVTVYVNRHMLLPLNLRYACRLLTGCGWSAEQVEVFKIEGSDQ